MQDQDSLTSLESKPPERTTCPIMAGQGAASGKSPRKNQRQCQKQGGYGAPATFGLIVSKKSESIVAAGKKGSLTPALDTIISPACAPRNEN